MGEGIKKINYFFITLFVSVLFLCVIGATAENYDHRYKVDSRVAEAFESNEKVKVIVMLKEQGKGDFAENSMRAQAVNSIGHQKVKHQFSSFNGFSAEITKEELENLKSNGAVEKIEYDYPVYPLLQNSAPLINATLAWSRNISNINITGLGETVCIIDTGVNYSHPDLGGCSLSLYTLAGISESYIIESWHNYTNDFDYTWNITKSGYSKIAVHFANISLIYPGEDEYDSSDRIIIYNSQMREIARYHGINGIIQNFWTPYSDGDTIYIRLKTDSIFTDYGFYVDQVRNGTTNSTYNWSSCSKVIGGWDFADNDGNPMDYQGHGTHVAGIVAASGNIKGIAPDAKIVAAKVFSSLGGGAYNSDVLAAIEFCTNRNIDLNISVISMSLGGRINYTSYCDSDNPSTSAAINLAVAKNITVVVASGNDGNYTSMSSPACIQNVTSVSATTKADAIASYSNRNNLTDVMAPGGDNSAVVANNINSTWINGAYSAISGTSMAAPHAAGAIALMQQSRKLETGKSYSVSEIERILKANGKTITDSATGLNFSRINAFNSIDSFIYPNYTWISYPNSTNVSQAVIINLSATDNVGVIFYNVTINSQQYSMTKSGNYYFYIYTPSSVGNVLYNATFRDAAGNSNTTNTITLSIGETTPPQYYNFSQSIFYRNYFNITWIDNINISSVWAVLNKSDGSLNATLNATLLNASVYFLNYTFAVGNYSLRWYANDTYGNINSTDMLNVSIMKASPALNLSLFLTVPYSSNILIENRTFVNITLSSSAEGAMQLFVNGTVINSGMSLISNLTQFNESWIGYPANITGFYNETANYTSDTRTYFIYVESSSTPPRSYKISPSNNYYSSSRNVTFRINATDATLKNATFYLWNSSSLLSMNSTNMTGMFNETNWSYSNLPEGNYSWNALIYDSSNNGNWTDGGNYTLIVDATNPSAVMSISSDTVNVNDYVSVTCNASDSNLDSIKIYVDDALKNSTFSAASLPYNHQAASSGTITVRCTAADKAGNSNTTSVSVTVSSPTVISGGVGGGGGGGGATVISETTVKFFDSISAGQSVKILTSLKTEETSSVSSVTVKVKNTASNVEFMLKRISESEVTVPLKQDNKKVHNYITIDHKNLNSSDIEWAVINFAVNKSWLDLNNLSKYSVRLERYSTSWEELKTEILSESASHVFYNATSPGLSVFAITASKPSAPVTVQKNETVALKEDEKMPQSRLYMIIGLIAAMIILSGVLYFLIMQKKRFVPNRNHLKENR